MKKRFVSLWICLIVLIALSGCKSWEDESKAEDYGKTKFKIVTTIFPEYDWVRNIVGENNENVEIQLILNNGVDLHSFQPSTYDLLAISQADLFIYVGGHSDEWVEEALKGPVNEDRVVINLFDVLKEDLKPLIETEGMEHHHHGEEEHDEEHHEEHHDEEDYCENDEHVWLSLRRSIKAIDYITKQLAQIDSNNSNVYEKNAEAYIEKLKQLDKNYSTMIGEEKKDTVVFADRFPFFYMADDYGLNYYAAFTGCSAESEASFETISELANKLDEYELNYVLTIENRTHKIPETVIENTLFKDQKILEMNSLQSVTEKDINEGLTYVAVMESNLDVLSTALQ